MVDISIQSGQGITQAIKAKIEGSGQKISNNDLSVWQDVMREVKTAQESGSQIYSGGDDVDQLNNKQNWKTDFKVAAGQVIQLAENVWNRIVELLTGKKPEVTQETPKEPPKLEKSEVKLAPEPKIDNPPELDIAELPQEVRKELTEATLDEIGAKTFTREVNGEKQEIAVLRDEDGNKVRRLINEDGTMGETLVPVSTFGKNKYITQTKMDDMIKNVFPEGLPEGVTASYVSIGGTPTLVFKKDGKTLDQTQLRELVKVQSDIGNNDSETVTRFSDGSTIEILDDNTKMHKFQDGTSYIYEKTEYGESLCKVNKPDGSIIEIPDNGTRIFKNAQGDITLKRLIRGNTRFDYDYSSMTRIIYEREDGQFVEKSRIPFTDEQMM